MSKLSTAFLPMLYLDELILEVCQENNAYSCIHNISYPLLKGFCLSAESAKFRQLARAPVEVLNEPCFSARRVLKPDWFVVSELSPRATQLSRALKWKCFPHKQYKQHSQ
jgi:hypothetical protein